MATANEIYSEVYHTMSKSPNPFDVYNNNQAYLGYERAKVDFKDLIVKLQTERMIGDYGYDKCTRDDS